jgi:hypothetical protein
MMGGRWFEGRGDGFLGHSLELLSHLIERLSDAFADLFGCPGSR